MVREVSSLASLIINFTPGNPAQALGAGLLFALALFPGGNFFVALALALPMMLAWSYGYGLLTAAIPRTGGDYTLVSRIIGPPFGIIVAFSQAVANFLSIAFFCIAIVDTAIGPTLVTFGLLGNHPGLVSWASNFSTSHGWQFGVGLVLIAFIAGMMWGGWRWTNTILIGLFTVTMTGVLASFLIALFTSHQGFVNDFNAVGAANSSGAHAYAATLANARQGGVNLHAPFSWSQTLPMIGILGTFIIYTYFSTYIGGELRRGRSVSTANRMSLAGLLNCSITAICVLAFFSTYGKPFITAAFGGFLPKTLPFQPYYFTLSGVAVRSSIVALLLGITYIAFWPTIGFVAALAPVRSLFAFAFDGILPKQVTNVSKRHAPWVAILVSSVFTALVLVWAIYVSTSFLQVIVYAVMVQLIAMTLLAVAAVIFPWRRPEMYRASVSAKTFLGIPVVSIAGLVAIVCGSAVLYYLYFHYPLLGVPHALPALEWMGGTVVAALLFYYVVRGVRRRQGVDLALVYDEIPPQ
jgi:amino acid transporter